MAKLGVTAAKGKFEIGKFCPFCLEREKEQNDSFNR
jgi:hypothetical protein